MRTGFTQRICSPMLYPLLLASALLVSLLPSLHAETLEKRNSAQAQFDRAEKQRTALNAKPLAERSLEDYKQTVTSYRRVYLITSHAMEVPAAIMAVAQLNTEMGQHFGSKYYQSAVNTYEYLLKQYPTSRYREEALLGIASIQKSNLGQAQLARRSFEQFLKAHPHSAHKREALEALAELAMARDLGVEIPREKTAATTREEQVAVVPVVERSVGESPEQKTVEAPSGKDGTSHVTGITAFNGQDKAQIVIALDKGVQFYSSRLAKPERVFFDLHPARLGRGVAAKIAESPSGLVRNVRMAQNQDGVVRVVFELQGAKEYTAALFDSPARLVIDFWGASTKTAKNAVKSRNSASPADSKNPHDKTGVSARPPVVNQPPKADAAEQKNTDKKNRNEKSVTASAGAPLVSPPVATPLPNVDPSEKKNVDKKMQSDKSASATVPLAVEPKPISAQPASIQRNTAGAMQPAIAQPEITGLPAEATIAAEKSLRSRRAAAERMVPPPAPEPTHNGKPSLTRALGLKVGRIVIDAGHGGHDTGTIGATGLMEKDLCLDIALRLGKIIQQRLPGAEVILTRQNDSFVALEDRTAIANLAKADLFLSIHANSSQDHHARGVETYYLNLTNSPEAMAVASRENAFARGGVHDLQDIVAKIARNEKLGESREFAEDVQISLTKRLQRLSQTTKNRGVRKAPFVVLIGADMPSVLAEISFLSNPVEEQLLKRPDNRQRIAEGLYQGVASYLQSVNSLSLNLPGRAAGTRSTLLEQSGNQR